MSRIGKKPILIPEEVEIKISGRKVEIQGKKGKLEQEIPDDVKVEIDESKKQIIVSLERRTKQSPALWGLTRALLQNAVDGVSKGFEKNLELVGVGYKVALEGKSIRLDVGYSHPVFLEIPEGLEVETGKNTIKISGIDKQKVGEFAAVIRRVRPPEPYKGKGIRYAGKKVRRKEGKKAGAAS